MTRASLQRLLRLVYIASFFLLPLGVMLLAPQRMANIPLRLGIFCLLLVGGSWLMTLAWPTYGWGAALLLTSLGYASVYKLASFIPDVSSYPLTLSWSEASRYYYASLWLPRHVYGISTSPSVLHPSRYLLQAIPFLLPGATLFIHRLWQVILWIVTAGLTSGVLARRLGKLGQKPAPTILLSLVLWAFLFLFQGPIYYHLLLMVILLLWGFDRHHFGRSLVLVLIASLWAGISRVNWLPVPGLLAAALYLMEEKAAGKALWRYLLPPAAWTLAGTVVAYASQLAYQNWSGNPPAWFGSSFTSDLLWYRLLPNPTFPMGILPSAIAVSLPLLALIVFRLYKSWREFHLIRLLGLAAILVVLFAGGVVVSVKIGGGSNLHNLDAYLALLLVISTYIYFMRIQPDQLADADRHDPAISSLPASQSPGKLEVILLAAVLVFPLYFALSAGGAVPKRDFSAAQSAIQVINQASQQAAKAGGEVLFISQRHLLTFGYVTGVPLVPEDELVFLMEMAMSDNRAYMDAFSTDVQHQRFALIVSEPLVIQYQGRTHSFGEENDAWVKGVSEPVLCYYQPSTQLNNVGVVLYTPRPQPCK